MSKTSEYCRRLIHLLFTEEITVEEMMREIREQQSFDFTRE